MKLTCFKFFSADVYNPRRSSASVAGPQINGKASDAALSWVPRFSATALEKPSMQLNPSVFILHALKMHATASELS